ncbi:unnamed protein product [Tilletia controversa]|uniref:Sec20 C-terminal domain-containing protein n=3 Tax=Tilletia TaxID=13289 RepID=A0A8X7MRZ8_9BASI|nr:hypothetical protein CF336_g3991 [Tilletia laevis]KAE8195227.1 hypothetical protein CF328_g4504 [Tilletia controversa]KAE8259236.1 hypothetical protein A4X03_0g4148 [Tilletia caries]KAE8199061.1 hypothetical protein CF335_g4253 [Tilletia laevis]KAE8246006.1 hypothetical protein A4X06_0g5260 [Tilletia controversa]
MAHPATLAASLERHLRAIETLSLPALSEASDKQSIEQADAQLAADLDAASDLFRRLRLGLDDAETAQERDDIEAVLVERGSELNRLRVSARSARSSAYARAKTVAAQAARKELSLLGSSSSAGFTRSSLANSAEGDKVQTASADVTSALQRTVQLLSNEVERSTFSAQLLEESSATLQLLGSEYTSFGNVLKNSVALIKSMEREDWWNFIMVAGSMAFFLSCVLYILKKRVYDNTAGVVISGAGSVWKGGRKALQAAQANKKAVASASSTAASISSVSSSLAKASSRAAAAAVSASSKAAAAAASASVAAAAAASLAARVSPPSFSAPEFGADEEVRPTATDSLQATIVSVFTAQAAEGREPTQTASLESSSNFAEPQIHEEL